MSEPPLTGERMFRDDVVRITVLALNTSVIENYTFSHCRILGPAVLVLNRCTMTECGFETPDIDAVFWEIAPTRLFVVGAVMVEGCLFSNCRFDGVGIAGPPHLRTQFEQALRPGPSGP